MNDRIHRCPSSRSVLPCQTIAFVNPGISTGASLTTNESVAGPELMNGVRFYFETFGFPVEAQCNEFDAPSEDHPGRIAWHGWAGKGEDRLDVHHAWLIENLEGGRVRILTQETQIGKPAQELAKAQPNPMINGHQDWLNGLVDAAKGLSF
ncbi:hypothetical protein [Pseudomonas putida]|uniref:hypothetical protein n=1 Tax=Pseudomonas putida TaxID=303 RepID=UPI00215A008F|nr:hypothetical protein [Pseudomonas putida]